MKSKFNFSTSLNPRLRRMLRLKHFGPGPMFHIQTSNKRGSCQSFCRCDFRQRNTHSSVLGDHYVHLINQGKCRAGPVSDDMKSKRLPTLVIPRFRATEREQTPSFDASGKSCLILSVPLRASNSKIVCFGTLPKLRMRKHQLTRPGSKFENSLPRPTVLLKH